MRNRRGWMNSALLSLLLLAASATMARAQNTISLTTPTSLPREHASSVYFPFTGDTDADALTYLAYWRTSDGPFAADSGVVLTRNDSQHFFTGSVFWLQPGIQYTAQIRVVDPDNGVNPLVQTVTFTTRKYENQVPIGQVWVDPVLGNDAQSTASFASPVRTIARAMDLVQSGGQIRLKPGVYYERDVATKRDGLSTTPCSIVGFGDPGSVILDGSTLDAAGNRVGANPTWQQAGSAPDFYYTTTLPGASPRADLVVLGDDQRLHRKETLDQIQNPSAYTGSIGSDHYFFPKQGYFLSGSTLYARSETPASAPGAFHVSQADFALLIVLHNQWRIDSLTFRYSGGSGIHLRKHYPTPQPYISEIAVRNCRFFDNRSHDVHGEIGVDFGLVENCEFRDTRVDQWNYFANKRRDGENRNAVVVRGKGWVIRNNSIDGHFNGIQFYGSWDDVDRGRDSDIYLNTLDHLGDDGLELDDTHGFNLAAWSNTVAHTNSGVSHGPLFSGPSYFMYNLVRDGDQVMGAGVPFGYGIKWAIEPCDAVTGNGDDAYCNQNSGEAWYVHNTFVSENYFTPAWNGDAPVRGKILRNNILASNEARTVYQVCPGTAREQVLPLDFNLHWSTPHPPTGGQFVSWGSSVGSLALLRTLFNYWLLEDHGLEAPPSFVNSAAQDFHLAPNTYGVDAGTLVRGINTAYHMNGQATKYECAPDMGAFESGCYSNGGGEDDGGGFIQPGRSNSGVLEYALLQAGANPSGASTRLMLALPTAQLVQVQVFDAAGRVVATLMNGQRLAAGLHLVRWDGRSASGRPVSPGAYFVQARTALGAIRRSVIRVE